MYDIDLQSRTPIYEQIYKKIVELIMKKELKPDDQLPSVRTLAKELGVNPNTISKAYLQLDNDKIIYSLPGRGSFVAKPDTEKIKIKALENFDTAVCEAFNVGLEKSDLIARINSIKENDI